MSRCWRGAGIEWASARALLDLSGVVMGEDVIEGVLAMEDGALEHFNRPEKGTDAGS